MHASTATTLVRQVGIELTGIDNRNANPSLPYKFSIVIHIEGFCFLFKKFKRVARDDMARKKGREGFVPKNEYVMKKCF